MSFLMFEVFQGPGGSFRYILVFWAVLKIYAKFWGKRREILSLGVYVKSFGGFLEKLLDFL